MLPPVSAARTSAIANSDTQPLPSPNAANLVTQMVEIDYQIGDAGCPQLTYLSDQ